MAVTAAAAACAVVCAEVGALVVASTGAALAGEVLKLAIVPLNVFDMVGRRKRYFQLY